MAELTTIAVSRRVKRRLDELRGKGESYNDLIDALLRDSLSRDVKAQLDELRGSPESYDDVVRGLLEAGRRDPDEVRAFLLLADLRRTKIRQEGEKIVVPEG